MICQMPKGNEARNPICGKSFPDHFAILPNGPANLGTGDYVRHLIVAHWNWLTALREAYESGEWKP